MHLTLLLEFLLIFVLIRSLRVAEAELNDHPCISHLFPQTQYSKFVFTRCKKAEISLKWKKSLSLFIDLNVRADEKTRFTITIGNHCVLPVKSTFVECRRGWLLQIGLVVQGPFEPMELEFGSDGTIREYRKQLNITCNRKPTIHDAGDGAVWSNFRVDVPWNVRDFRMNVDASYGGLLGEFRPPLTTRN